MKAEIKHKGIHERFSRRYFCVSSHAILQMVQFVHLSKILSHWKKTFHKIQTGLLSILLTTSMLFLLYILCKNKQPLCGHCSNLFSNATDVQETWRGEGCLGG